jgi:LysR family transcriptional regulator, glycine cleavage system transcriptional activator
MAHTPHLPLQTLPAFRVVAKLQNLREAASALHITPSAVSQQIKLLEEQLGFALFDRRGRRVVLNEAGATLQRVVEPALDRLHEGVRMAAAATAGAAQRIRLTLLPSFAQRWLLPRMAGWRRLHPDITLEVHSSQQLVDLQRDGFHAALRQGSGHWRGLTAEKLLDSPLIAVGSPQAARRLRGRGTASLADEPLLGEAQLWERWFALDCCLPPINPVADFNDAGHMLQAAEQDIGIALVRELLAADGLRSKRLVRLSPLALPNETAYAYWLAYPPENADWPPLVALRAWLQAELAASLQGLPRLSLARPNAKTAAAGQTKSRSRAR